MIDVGLVYDFRFCVSCMIFFSYDFTRSLTLKLLIVHNIMILANQSRTQWLSDRLLRGVSRVRSIEQIFVWPTGVPGLAVCVCVFSMSVSEWGNFKKKRGFGGNSV